MQGESLCSHQPCDLGLVLHLHDRCIDNAFRLRIENHELVGMKAEPHIMRPRSCRCFEQRPLYLLPVWKVFRMVSADWVCRQRHELARNSECMNSEGCTALDRIDEGLGVGQDDFREIDTALTPTEGIGEAMRCLSEANRRVQELTAQPPAETRTGKKNGSIVRCPRFRYSVAVLTEP